MISATIALGETEVGAEQDVVQILLADPEWVDAEFLAILQASGLVGSLATGASPRPAFLADHAADRRGAVLRVDTRQERQTSAGTRVRSPPADRL